MSAPPNNYKTPKQFWRVRYVVSILSIVYSTKNGTVLLRKSVHPFTSSAPNTLHSDAQFANWAHSPSRDARSITVMSSCRMSIVLQRFQPKLECIKKNFSRRRQYKISWSMMLLPFFNSFVQTDRFFFLTGATHWCINAYEVLFKLQTALAWLCDVYCFVYYMNLMRSGLNEKCTITISMIASVWGQFQSCYRRSEEAGLGAGSTEHAAPTLFNPFKEHWYINSCTYQFLSNIGSKWIK